jgi:hypothetical protein
MPPRYLTVCSAAALLGYAALGAYLILKGHTLSGWAMTITGVAVGTMLVGQSRIGGGKVDQHEPMPSCSRSQHRRL